MLLKTGDHFGRFSGGLLLCAGGIGVCICCVHHNLFYSNQRAARYQGDYNWKRDYFCKNDNPVPQNASHSYIPTVIIVWRHCGLPMEFVHDCSSQLSFFVHDLSPYSSSSDKKRRFYAAVIFHFICSCLCISHLLAYFAGLLGEDDAGDPEARPAAYQGCRTVGPAARRDVCRGTPLSEGEANWSLAFSPNDWLCKEVRW